ncbi:MAG: hypothetical protein JNM95_00990 [Chitinophagaceae bacterium]|nr:hypothetical protein [Chitinophagaceae bacterium]
MKKLILFAFTLLSLASTVNAQKEKDTRYGKNIVSFIPFAAFTKNSVGVGASYEGMLNEYIGLKVPLFTAINQRYYAAALALKLYPTKNNGPAKYAIAPTLMFGAGDERDGGRILDPATNTFTNTTTQRTRFGFLLNNTFNFTIMKQFYIGIDGGLGVNYYDQEVKNNGAQFNSTSFLAQIHFSTGYRF